MNKRNSILLCSALIVISLLVVSGMLLHQPKQSTAVKSAQTMAEPTPTTTPTPRQTASPSATLVPTKTVIKATPTAISKSVGAWYWKEDLGHAQRYLGLDKEGREIWVNTGDPTATPTNTPERRQSAGIGQVQQKVNSSIGVSIQSVSKP